MKWRRFGFGAVLLVGLLTSGDGISLTGDPVSKAFDTYEALWRDGVSEAAQKLESGELTTDTETREFISAANQEARKQAFRAIAEAESKALEEWTAEKHAKILRGYK